MAISFNTGITASSGVSSVASQAVTIPAGVNAGDVIVVVFAGFRSSVVNETVQASSTGTAPVIIGITQNVTFNGSTMTAAIFSVKATASDAGKVITGSLVSGDTAQWATALGAWSGASASNPVDVSGAATASGFGSSITLPSRTTTVAGDWALQIVGAALGGATFTGGAGFTQREAISDASSGATGLIYDSNASFAAGTSIGGAVFSNAGQNSWWAGFTIGLAPPSAGGGLPAVSDMESRLIRRYRHMQRRHGLDGDPPEVSMLAAPVAMEVPPGWPGTWPVQPPEPELEPELVPPPPLLVPSLPPVLAGLAEHRWPGVWPDPLPEPELVQSPSAVAPRWRPVYTRPPKAVRARQVPRGAMMPVWRKDGR